MVARIALSGVTARQARGRVIPNGLLMSRFCQPEEERTNLIRQPTPLRAQGSICGMRIVNIIVRRKHLQDAENDII